MQVSSYTPYVPTQNNPLEKYQDLSSEDQDKARGVATGIAANQSREAQIDAYVAGSGNENNNEQSDTTQAYVDFASDVRRVNNIETVVNSGFEPKNDDEVTTPVEPTPLERFQELSVDAKRHEAINAYESNAIGFNIA